MNDLTCLTTLEPAAKNPIIRKSPSGVGAPSGTFSYYWVIALDVLCVGFHLVHSAVICLYTDSNAFTSFTSKRQRKRGIPWITTLSFHFHSFSFTTLSQPAKKGSNLKLQRSKLQAFANVY